MVGRGPQQEAAKSSQGRGRLTLECQDNRGYSSLGGFRNENHEGYKTVRGWNETPKFRALMGSWKQLQPL